MLVQACNITIQPYEIPGGTANSEVAVSFELVDANGAAQLGYDSILGEGIAGALTTIVRSEVLVIPLQTTESLVPPLYWRFKAQWGSASGYRSYTSGLIAIADASPDLSLPEFLALEEIPGTITGLTADEVAAIRAAASPDANNAFATMADVVGVDGAIDGQIAVFSGGANDWVPTTVLSGCTSIAVVDIIPDPQVVGTLYFVKP